ncbi:MAG: hypothetical protein KDA66_18975 [Planctomycetaceae bacterium]|nr:hypothetical protein [Planctomycetaceae bacterium]
MDFASEYLTLATRCQSVDYDNPSSIRQYNDASDRMRKLVQNAESFGQTAVQSLVPLLKDPIAAPWLAHHLVELTTIDSAIRKECVMLVQDFVAKLEQEGKCADAMGERYWLKEWGT